MSRSTSVDSILNFQFNFILTEATNLIYARGSCHLKFDVETAAPQGQFATKQKSKKSDLSFLTWLWCFGHSKIICEIGKKKGRLFDSQLINFNHTLILESDEILPYTSIWKRDVRKCGYIPFQVNLFPSFLSFLRVLISHPIGNKIVA